MAPSGKKRNPYSFTPFFGGKRVCIGKTFAETVARFVVPSLFVKYDFELKDIEKYKVDKPAINVDVNKDPEVLAKIRVRDSFKSVFA